MLYEAENMKLKKHMNRPKRAKCIISAKRKQCTKRIFVKTSGFLAVALAVIGGVSGCSRGKDDEASAHVYFLNSRPELADKWAKIAEKYSDEKNVDVVVKTPAAGTYESVMKAEIAKNEPPTIFQVDSPATLKIWETYCDDMSGTALYDQLDDKESVLRSGSGFVAAVPYSTDSFGIVYNRDLLEKYIALPDSLVESVSQINAFDVLRKVADDIQAHKDELGIKGAFVPSGFDSGASECFHTYLAGLALYGEFRDENTAGGSDDENAAGRTPADNSLSDSSPSSVKGTYLNNLRNVLDVYYSDSYASESRSELSFMQTADSVKSFAAGEGVFYQSGTWVWQALKSAGMSADSVEMLPAYIGLPNESDTGLLTADGNYLCVNSKVPDEDRQASKDFLDWMIASEEGKTVLSETMGISAPFKSMHAFPAVNPLVAAAKKDSQKHQQVSGAHLAIPSLKWKTDLAAAMLNYVQAGSAGDDSALTDSALTDSALNDSAHADSEWRKVESAFVDGWAREYASAQK